MTPDVWAEATAQADRTRAVINGSCSDVNCDDAPCIALARLDSDLASLRDALDGLAEHEGRCPPYHPCPDTARCYSQRDRALTELDRTAKAYGV